MTVESAEDLAALFDPDGFADWARWRAGGQGSGKRVLVIEDAGDTSFAALGHGVVSDQRVYLMQVSDAPSLAKGDTLELENEGVPRVLPAPPQRDAVRHVWSFGVTP